MPVEHLAEFCDLDLGVVDVADDMGFEHLGHLAIDGLKNVELAGCHGSNPVGDEPQISVERKPVASK